MMKQLQIICATAFGALSLLIATPVSAKIIADFESEFSGKIAAQGWSYQWNPTGVEIGNQAGYQDLESIKNFRWIVDKNKIPGKHTGPTNATWLMIKQGQMASGDSHKHSTDNISHYAIAGYTIQPGEAGQCSIVESTLQHVNHSGSAEIQIYVNDRLIGSDIAEGSSKQAFDVSLGHLQEGDTVYIAIGPQKSTTLIEIQFKIDSQ